MSVSTMTVKKSEEVQNHQQLMKLPVQSWSAQDTPDKNSSRGVIDEVYLFNRAISTDEINTIRAGDFAPVQPAEKLTTTWGAIKTNRKH